MEDFTYDRSLSERAHSFFNELTDSKPTLNQRIAFGDFMKFINSYQDDVNEALGKLARYSSSFRMICPVCDLLINKKSVKKHEQSSRHKLALLKTHSASPDSSSDVGSGIGSLSL